MSLAKNESYYSNYRYEMLDFLPKEAKTFLELGCSEGKFGKQIKEQGKTVWGSEYVPETAAKASLVLDKVLVGDINEHYKELPDNYFDCIISNDVLEHLTYPTETFQKLAPKLKADGFIVASIPNVRYIKNLYNLIFRKDWKYENEGILDNTHFRFFTEKSIVRFFDEINFEIVRMEGINPSGNSILKLINFLTFNFFEDTKYLQFAVLAKKK